MLGTPNEEASAWRWPLVFGVVQVRRIKDAAAQTARSAGPGWAPPADSTADSAARSGSAAARRSRRAWSYSLVRATGGWSRVRRRRFCRAPQMALENSWIFVEDSRVPDRRTAMPRSHGRPPFSAGLI